MGYLFAQKAGTATICDSTNARRVSGDSVEWVEISDVNAANDLALKPTASEWDKSQGAKLYFDIDVHTAGTYKLWIRGDTGGTSAAIWFSGRKGHAVWFKMDGYQWKSNDQALIDLEVGIQTVTITSIHSHFIIDKIMLLPPANNNNDGSTAETPAESAKTEFSAFDSASLPDGTFQKWLDNSANDQYRTILVELDHSGGTVFLSTRAYVSERGVVYDNWLIGSPIISQSLDESLTVGDLEAVNPHDNSWLKYQFFGHQCRMYQGDIRWKKSLFRRIATADITSDADLIGPSKYSFDLGSMTNRYDRVFPNLTAETAFVGTFADAVQWVVDHTPLATGFEFINTADQESIELDFTVDGDTNILATLETIAASVGGYLRIAQYGQVEIVRPDPSVYKTITKDSLRRNSLTSSGTENAYRYFVVYYAGTDANGDQNKVEYDSGVDSGGYSQTLEITTFCKHVADAEKVLSDAIARHVNRVDGFNAQVLHLPSMLNTGDYVRFENEDGFEGLGLITDLERQPSFADTDIRVAIA